MSLRTLANLKLNKKRKNIRNRYKFRAKELRARTHNPTHTLQNSLICKPHTHTLAYTEKGKALEMQSKCSKRPLSDYDKILRLQQPNAILISIYDALINRQQNEEFTLRFCQDNLLRYLRQHWNESKVIRLVQRMVRESQVNAFADHRPDPLSSTNERPSVDLVHSYLNALLQTRPPPNSIVYLVQRWVRQEGFEKGELYSVLAEIGSSHVLQHWRMKLFVKLFCISEQDQKMQR